jgi:hypothetical protein
MTKLSIYTSVATYFARFDDKGIKNGCAGVAKIRSTSDHEMLASRVTSCRNIMIFGIPDVSLSLNTQFET